MCERDYPPFIERINLRINLEKNSLYTISISWQLRLVNKLTFVQNLLCMIKRKSWDVQRTYWPIPGIKKQEMLV